MDSERRKLALDNYTATHIRFIIDVIAELERVMSAFGYSLKSGLRTNAQRFCKPPEGAVYFDVVGWDHRVDVGHVSATILETEDGFEIKTVMLSLPRWSRGAWTKLEAARVDPSWVGSYNYKEIGGSVGIEEDVENCLAKYREKFLRVR